MTKRIFSLFLALQLVSSAAFAGGSQPAAPGGTNGQVQYNNAGFLGGLTIGGDCSINVGTGALTCTKTGGVLFAPSATTDTTNANNIASGTLAAARLPYALSGITGAQGNGTKVQLSTGTTTTNNCVKFDVNGNTVDAGAPCGSGGSVSITSASPDLVVSPSPLTGTGTISSTSPLNAQGNAASYTFLTGDMGKTVTHNRSTAVADTLPQAGTTGFEGGKSFSFMNFGAGAVTNTASGTSTINGASSQILHKNGWAFDISDGSNWLSLGFPGFDTITANSVPKFSDASGATTASGISDSGSTITFGENAVATGTMTLSAISGSTQCLHVNSSGLVTGTGSDCGAGGGSVTWPTSGNIVVSNGTSTPAGLSPVNGNCVVGSGGAWVAGSCSGTSSSNLGASTSATSPQITGDATTGLYTSGAGKVDLAIGGANLMDWSSAGQVITSNSATALAVGLAGATNPVWQVDSSTGSQDSGVKLTGAVSGGSSTFQAIGSNANVGINFKSKGISGITFNSGVSGPITFNGTQYSFAPIAFTSSPITHFSFTAPADSGITAGTNNRLVNFDLSATRTHTGGALSLQSDFDIAGGTDAFTSASTLTNGATVRLTGKSCGTNGTCTNESALYAPTTALTGTITNSFKVNVEADSGATNNFAERVIGPVLNGGTSPTIAAGAGAGTSPTVSLTGPVAGGTVNATTGTSPTGSNATIVTVTFPVAFPTGSSVTITPGNAATAALTGTTGVYAVPTTTGFTIVSGSSALSASTAYVFNYRVTGY